MNTIDSVLEFRNLRSQLGPELSLGFIPTMGALHAGHLSLIEKSLQQNDVTCVSIFLNPTQFNDPKDLQKYPSQQEADLQLLQSCEVNWVFTPDNQQLYPQNYRYKVSESEFSNNLCGASREGHFTGVLTVVLKLLNIVQPTRAYFGEKDYQQYKLIKGMIESLFVPTEIISCPTVREESGLAMSSRNMLLSEEHRQLAPKLYKTIRSNCSASDARINLEESGFQVDYIKDLNNRRYAAATLGTVRLIDNVER